MKYFHLLTVILFLLKVLNVAQLTWVMVFLPSLIAIGVGLLLFIIAFILTVIANL